MLLSVGLIALGLVLLVLGGELLLRGAVGLATLLRVTPAVIGLTIVAAGTSVPELAVSVLAAYQGAADIAVGNVVGSNIFNITLILGVCALLRPLTITGNTVKFEYPAMALVTALFVALSFQGGLGLRDGALFLALYVCFTAFMVALVRRQMNETEVEEFTGEVKELTPAVPRPSALLCLVLVVGGVGFLAGGAHATVLGARDLARLLGVSDRVIALTIVAGGTSLPEIVTSLVSSFRGRDDVAIGNVIGSNLFNLLGILGVSALIRPLTAAVPLRVAPEIVAGDNWWMLGVTLLLFPLMHFGLKIGRRKGLLLVVVYGVYVTILLTPGGE